MMRTAKDFIFRRYCVKDKYMSQEYEGAVAFDISADDDIIMQWTGLLDKNGKKIFEGDIIELKGERPRIKGVRNKKSSYYGRGVIKYQTWIEPCFVVSEIIESEHWVFYDPESICFNWNDAEVIGNIYQNPELLERAE